MYDSYAVPELYERAFAETGQYDPTDINTQEKFAFFKKLTWNQYRAMRKDANNNAEWAYPKYHLEEWVQRLEEHGLHVTNKTDVRAIMLAVNGLEEKQFDKLAFTELETSMANNTER
jgi:hypothetical protein